MVIDNLPFDKYELEPSPLTQLVLSRKQPQAAWQCFVSNSHKNSELGLPFGYLKASTSLNCVNLFVMPYNYPVLLPLLDELFKVHNWKPSREWKIAFDTYIKNLPLYYVSPLKRALQRMGATPNLVPDNLENCLSYAVLNNLKKLKNQAKAEFEKMVVSVGSSKSVIPDVMRVLNAASTRKISEMSLGITSSNSRFVGLKNDLNEFTGFQISIKNQSTEVKSQCYRNPYDITRHELIDQIHRMRLNFLQPPGLVKFQDEDQIHSLPVSQMGNYQEYLKKIATPLRELESAPVRQHMFGNPFKLDKRGMMIDETDIDLVGNGGGTQIRSPKRPAETFQANPNRVKRKPGPLPKDYVALRSPSPILISPPPSPLPLPPTSPTLEALVSLPSPPLSPTSPSPPLSPKPEILSSFKSHNASLPPVDSMPPRGTFMPLVSDNAMPQDSYFNSSDMSSTDIFEHPNNNDILSPTVMNNIHAQSNHVIKNDSSSFQDPEMNNFDNKVDDDEEDYSLVSLSQREETPFSFAPGQIRSNDIYNGELEKLVTTGGYSDSRSSPPVPNGAAKCNMLTMNNTLEDSLSRLCLTDEDKKLKSQLFRLVRKPGMGM